MVRPVQELRDALAIAVEAARAAGRTLLEGFGQGPAALLGRRQGVDTKSAAYDLVTEFDRRSEALLVAKLAAAFPDDEIIAEEGGSHAGTKARWYVDPLDGTTNFAHGLPMFCVAIGRVTGSSAPPSGGAARSGGAGPCDDGRVDVGVIHAPVLGWTFTATRGGGAWCGDRRLAVSTNDALASAMFGTGFPSDRATSADNNFAQFVAVKPRVRAVRRLGSAALDQALVAAGTYDGFWEMKLKPWDLAAGSLLVEEAGGQTTGWAGEPLSLVRGAIVASNGRLHGRLLELLASPGLPAAVR
jgi:myo-inositol-1(or 4)-monophosphatase